MAFKREGTTIMAKLFNIKKSGDPKIGSVIATINHDNIRVVEFDMLTKRHEISWLGEFSMNGKSYNHPELTIGTTDETPNIGKTNNYTVVGFPAFRGWEIYMAEASKKSIRIVFVKAH
jgi:hypothetical protein